MACMILYEKCLDFPLAKVVNIEAELEIDQNEDSEISVLSDAIIEIDKSAVPEGNNGATHSIFLLEIHVDLTGRASPNLQTVKP